MPPHGPNVGGAPSSHDVPTNDPAVDVSDEEDIEVQLAEEEARRARQALFLHEDAAAQKVGKGGGWNNARNGFVSMDTLCFASAAEITALFLPSEGERDEEKASSAKPAVTPTRRKTFAMQQKKRREVSRHLAEQEDENNGIKNDDESDIRTLNFVFFSPFRVQRQEAGRPPACTHSAARTGSPSEWRVRILGVLFCKAGE